MPPNIIFSTLPCSGASALDPIFRALLPGAGYEITPFGPEATPRLSEFYDTREPFYHWTHDPPETFAKYLGQSNFKFIYLHRDLRDVAISAAHDILLNDLMPGHNLRQLLELMFTPAASSILPHVRSAVRWISQPDVQVIKFVDIKSDIRSVLNRCFVNCRVCIQPELLDQTVAVHSFEAVTGRDRGERGPFVRNAYMLRRGISGEYKEHFDEQLATMCHQALGVELIALGYETDANWINAISENH